MSENSEDKVRTALTLLSGIPDQPKPPKKIYQQVMQHTIFGTSYVRKLTPEGAKYYAELAERKAQEYRDAEKLKDAPLVRPSAAKENDFKKEQQKGYNRPRDKDRDDDLGI